MKRQILINLLRLLQLTLLLLVFWACQEQPKVRPEIEEIPVDLEVKRFDREFATATGTDLAQLKLRYPYLFPVQYADSIWLMKMQDTLQHSLYSEIDNTFGDFVEEETGLELLYKHIRYYFPGQTLPGVVTVSSDVDYNNRVILTDTLLLIGLDNYLGQDHRFYSGIDRYIAADLDKKYLESDVAGAFAKKVIPPPADRTFLAQMIYYGKELYLKDVLLPLAEDEVKIGYSEEQLEWAAANEEQIWRYFVEKELLYSTDRKLGPRFLDPAPFSKFRLALDNESPGRIGRYMGWQIVRSYAEKHEVPLQRILQMPAKTLFQEANYKPKR